MHCRGLTNAVGAARLGDKKSVGASDYSPAIVVSDKSSI